MFNKDKVTHVHRWKHAHMARAVDEKADSQDPIITSWPTWQDALEKSDHSSKLNFSHSKRSF